MGQRHNRLSEGINPALAEHKEKPRQSPRPRLDFPPSGQSPYEQCIHSHSRAPSPFIGTSTSLAAAVQAKA